MAGWTDFLCGEGKGQMGEVSSSPRMGCFLRFLGSHPLGTGALYWLDDIRKLWGITSGE